MKIIIEDRSPNEEDTVIVRCNDLDDSLLKLIYGFKMGNNKIVATKDGEITMIAPRDIYYFETVDNKIFLYLTKDVYETKLKLYEIEKEFAGTDFFRASKSTIVNLAKVKSLSPALSGRFEAILLNEERVIISRQYVSELKNKLNF